MRREDAVVVGGGAVGVACAYYLADAGRDVCLLERSRLCAGASYGNAGLVPPSRSIPLAGPGVIPKALRWALDADGPFRLKLRPDPDLLAWLLRFRSCCTADAVRSSTVIIRDATRASLGLFEELARLPGLDFCYRRNGYLVLFRTPEGSEYARAELGLLEEFGIEGKLLDRDAAARIEPLIGPTVEGAAHYPEDAHLDPARFVTGLAGVAQQRGVRIETGTEVRAVSPNRNSLHVRTSAGELDTSIVVLANGAWSRGIARDLGLRLLLEPAKGYGLTLPRELLPVDIPLLLSEARATATPMGDNVRLTGKLDLVGYDLSLDSRRVRGIPEAMRAYLAVDGELEPYEEWCGLRPLTPDGLPVIGPHPGSDRLLLATGHGRLGVALAPLTGRIVTELAAGEPPSFNNGPFAPTRFGGIRRPRER